MLSLSLSLSLSLLQTTIHIKSFFLQNKQQMGELFSSSFSATTAELTKKNLLPFVLSPQLERGEGRGGVENAKTSRGKFVKKS